MQGKHKNRLEEQSTGMFATQTSLHRKKSLNSQRTLHWFIFLKRSQLKRFRKSMEKAWLDIPCNIKAVLYDGSYHDVDSMKWPLNQLLRLHLKVLSASTSTSRASYGLKYWYQAIYGRRMGDCEKRKDLRHGSSINSKQKIIAEVPQENV